MNINFSYAAFNSVYANQAGSNIGLGSIANAIKPDGADDKNKKPLNMDTVSLSSQLSAQMRKMAEATKPVEQTAAADNELVEKTEDLIKPAEPIRAHGATADKLKVANNGIETNIGSMEEMQDIVEKANDEDAQLTDRDRQELQKELDFLKAEINKISENVLAETGDAFGDTFKMDAERFGIQDLSVLTIEDSENAVEILDKAIKDAKEMRDEIQKRLKEIEEQQQDEKSSRVDNALDQLEQNAQEMQQVENSLNPAAEAEQSLTEKLNELITKAETDEKSPVDDESKPLDAAKPAGSVSQAAIQRDA